MQDHFEDASLRSNANHKEDSSGAGEGSATEPLCDSVPDLEPRLVDNLPGAPPSNTAPANCIEGQHRVLRAGVDSLYLSFKGDLFEVIELTLIELKSLAQSDDPLEVANAVFEIEGHRFEVLGRGSRNYPFILKDGSFNIQLSSESSESLPLAYVQISSHCLTESGFLGPVQELKKILRHLGTFSEIKVSRLDICCDFTTIVGFGELPEVGWISRSNKRTSYFENEQFSGFVFGQGSRISARLYDKTLEIKKSKKDYLRGLWWSEGWDRDCQVWRLEFQVMRSVLVELGILRFDHLVGSLDELWKYATTNWLRLVLPGKDKTKSRWPSHPLWEELQQANFGGGCCEEISKRQITQRVPSNDYFFINGLAAFTSFMAARGIDTFEEAGPLFLQEAKEYHACQSLGTDEGIEEYCQSRAALKARKYSTRFKRTDKGEGEDET